MKKRRVMQPEIVDKTRATTSKNQMKPLMTPNYLILQGKRAKYLKSTSRYKKNPSSIEGEFKSTLMSERVSRNTSIDELKETMKSVYGKDPKSTKRAFSPITKASSFHNLKPIDLKKLQRTKSPPLTTPSHPTRYFNTRNKKLLSSRQDLRDHIKRAVSRQ